MNQQTAVILTTGVLAATLVAYAFAKKKPYITSSILGSFGAFGLLYALTREST